MSSKREFGEHAHEFYSKTKLIVLNWMYSWMKSGIETREEYILSKYLLLKYVKSPEIFQQLGDLMAAHFVLFLRKHIEVHESKYLFYLRKHVRHYGVYSNAIHEGTNNALKTAVFR